ncbi:MAG: diguanylate cyclase [Spirochaetales bacterium]|nr:diguanylate cyclase [Spirochaetales bacterium]
MDEDGKNIPSNRILYWPDKRKNQAILDILPAGAYQIIEAMDADQCASMADETIDLLLLHSEAVMQAGGLIRKIRQNEKLSMIPIVALCDQKIEESAVEKMYELGVTDCLNFPCPGFISRIQTHVQMKKQLEGLRKLNRRLNSELEFHKKQNTIILDFSKTIENDLLEKIDKLKSGENPENLKKEILGYQVQLADLTEERERLRRDNQSFREELIKFQKINSVVIMHSQAIDEDMYQKINHISQKANTDHLTGIFNRLKFHENLYQEINGTNSPDKVLSIAMFDIDHFKDINDRYGHDIGDDVLMELTAFIGQMITEKDTFARWGGEEFMLLLPGKSCDEAYEVAEKIRNVVETESFADVDGISCSFGVTQYQGEDISLFLKRVDCAMYLAKKKGRNRVEKL